MTRILIIDDESMVRFSLRRLLEGVGYEIAEAEISRDSVVAR